MADETSTFTLEGDFDELIKSLRKLADGFEDVTKASDKTEKQASKSRKALDAIKSGATAAVNGLGAMSAAALAAGAGFGALANEVLETHRELDRLSTTSGISVKSLNGLRVAAGATGKELDDIAPDDFGERMLDAAQGGNDAAAAFHALGVNVTDSRGRLRDTDTVLKEVITALQGVDHAGARAGLTTLALGENGGRLMTALGDKRIEEFVDLAGKYGTDIGPEATARAEQWGGAMGSLNLAIEDAKDAIFGAFGSAATAAVNNFSLGLVFVAAFSERAAANLSALWNRQLDDVKTFRQTYSDAMLDVMAFWEAQSDGAEQAAVFVGPTLEMLGRGTSAQKDWAKALAGTSDATTKLKQAQEGLARIVDTANLEGLEGFDAIHKAHKQRLLDIFDLGKAGADTSDALVAAEQSRVRRVEALRDEENQKLADDASDSIDDLIREWERLGDSIERTYDEANKKAEESAKQQKEALTLLKDSAEAAFSDALQGFGDVAKLREQNTAEEASTEKERLERQRERHKELLAQADEAMRAGDKEKEAALRNEAAQVAERKKNTKGRLDALRDELNQRHKAVVAAFRMEQALAIAQIVQQSAVLAMTLAAALAPVLLVAAPIVAGGIAAISAAGQIASVVAQKPPPAPKFHDGTSSMLAPDEFGFAGSVLRNGEQLAVLNQRAAETGGGAVVDDLNRGGSSMGPTVLRLENAGAVIAEAILSEVENSTRAGRALRAAFTGRTRSAR